MAMNGLSSISIELTSRCNKGDGTPGSGCFMCGRRKMEREHPEKCDWGDMDFAMLEKIARQVPPGITVQLHNNGEPTLYPRLRDALRLFKDNVTGFDTNGKLLMDKANEIIGELDTVTVSVIQEDPEQAEQMQVLDQFLAEKGNQRPMVILRILGDVDHNAIPTRIYDLCEKVYRVLHSPDGSNRYKKPVTKPEMGICLEMLHKLSIDRKGNVSPCVRFDPDGLNVIDNVSFLTLEDIWNNGRVDMLWWHKIGKREEIPLCARCDYWGVARG